MNEYKNLTNYNQLVVDDGNISHLARHLIKQLWKNLYEFHGKL